MWEKYIKNVLQNALLSKLQNNPPQEAFLQKNVLQNAFCVKMAMECSF